METTNETNQYVLDREIETKYHKSLSYRYIKGKHPNAVVQDIVELPNGDFDILWREETIADKEFTTTVRIERSITEPIEAALGSLQYTAFKKSALTAFKMEKGLDAFVISVKVLTDTSASIVWKNEETDVETYVSVVAKNDNGRMEVTSTVTV